MAQKTYIAHRKGLSLAWEKHPAINFVNEKRVTSNEAEQAYIESLPVFQDDTVTLEGPADILAAAVAKAAPLRAAADAAEKLAKAAEAVVASLEPKKAAAVKS